MEFEVLGSIRLRGADGTVEPTGRLRRALLGVLLSRANETVPASALADAMWGDQPDARTGQRLQLHVHKLRQVMDQPDRLSFASSGYRLTVLPGELDAERFTALVTEAMHLAEDDPRRCSELIRKALAFWRGTPFTGLDIPLLADEARRLTELRLTALEVLYQAELAAGRHTEILSELTGLARQHPLRERLHELLMLTLYRAGRQADALAVYRQTRRALIDELGVEPGTALRELEQRILIGEPEVPGAVPAQLPHKVCGFVGRTTELSELDRAVAMASIAALTGTAGVGKTALAVHWAHLVRHRFPDGQLYLDLRGYGPEDPVSPADALAGFLRALGVEGAAIPQDLAERSARFRTLVASRRMLVVLDNARTVEQVRPLLPGAPTAFALVTSRDSLAGLVARDGAHRIALDRLSADESLDLIRSVAGEATGAIDTMVELCARLPLALRIAAELLRTRRGGNVAELVAELADEQRRLDLFDADGEPHTAVRSVFSWSYQHLPAQAARAFRLLGLHPGREVDAYALATLSELDLWETRRALDTLVRAHLVDETQPGRFQQHDLLRAYAAELAMATEDVAAALTRLYDYYQHTAKLATNFLGYQDPRPETPVPPGPVPAFTDHDDAFRWLDAERHNLLAVAEHAVRDPGSPVPTNLSTLLWRSLDTAGYHDEAATLHALAVTAGIDAFYADAGRLHDAIQFFEQAIAIRGQFDVPHHNVTDQTSAPGLAAYVMYKLAELRDDQNRLDEARDLLERVLILTRGSTSRTGHALAALGRVHRELGNLDEALTHLHSALAIGQHIGERDLTVKTLNRLGQTYLQAGAPASALPLHREAIAIASAIDDRVELAEAHKALGNTHAALDDHREAARHCQSALVIYREMAELG